MAFSPETAKDAMSVLDDEYAQLAAETEKQLSNSESMQVESVNPKKQRKEDGKDEENVEDSKGVERDVYATLSLEADEISEIKMAGHGSIYGLEKGELPDSRETRTLVDPCVTSSSNTLISQDSNSKELQESGFNDLSKLAVDLGERNEFEGDGSAAGRESIEANIGPNAEDTKLSDTGLGEDSPQGAATSQVHPSQSLYHIKWVQWKGMNTPIITQNENGPCPLLAIINVLLLQRKISIPSMQEIVSAAQLMEYLGDCILEQAPEKLPEGAQLNYEQNMHDAIGIMCKLQTGLDVNVKFTGVADFEFTPECVVFDLLDIRLLHGWLIDPQNQEGITAISSSSYNQLVEKIIASKQEGADCKLLTEGLIAEAFLEQSATQLTYHGLYELNTRMDEEELCVFFRNNHFNTLYKHKKELFLLATDQGYLTEEKVVWETLSNVEGDGCFVDANFRTVSQMQQPPVEVAKPPPVPPTQGISQEDQDYLVALTLQEEQAKAEAREREGQVPQGPPSNQPQLSFAPPSGGPNMSPQEWNDLQLAMQLQEEERRQQQQQQQQSLQQSRPLAGPVRRAPHHSVAGRPTRQHVQPQTAQQSQNSNDKCTIL